MIDLTSIATDLAWPMTLLIAWLAGELGHLWAGLPRISVYAIVGFALASTQAGLLPESPAVGTLLLANIAFGLILFEAGHRINLRWLWFNPWVGLTSLAEAILTFGAVYAVARGFEMSTSNALLLAALAMATSPATVIRVVNEQRSSGQVTERVLHLSALNCVMAVFAFKLVIGLEVFRTSGSIREAAYASLIVLSTSAVLGALFGLVMPTLLRAVKRTPNDSTFAFAIAVIFLVALTHSLKQSPVLATLTFGLVARHCRIALGQSQRGFGALGDLMSLLLFVFVAATLEWQKVTAGIGLGVAIIAARFAAKMIGVGIFAHISGISWRKGLLTGMAMTPISAFVILVLEQTRYLGIDLVDQLSPLAAATLTLEIIGPIVTQRALMRAREVQDTEEC